MLIRWCTVRENGSDQERAHREQRCSYEVPLLDAASLHPDNTPLSERVQPTTRQLVAQIAEAPGVAVAHGIGGEYITT